MESTNEINTGKISIDQESRNMALLIWIGTIFFGFIPGLIFYLIKKDNPYVMNQAKEALNLSITVMLAYFAGFILTFILIGILVIFAVAIGNLVICIMGAVKCADGQDFKAPFVLRLIK